MAGNNWIIPVLSMRCRLGSLKEETEKRKFIEKGPWFLMNTLLFLQKWGKV